MDNIYRCVKCGWIRVTWEEIEGNCPICDNRLRLESFGEGDDERILQLLQEEEINDMKNTIRVSGDRLVWNLIEKKKNYYIRLDEREIFFLAGGVVPNKEIKI